MRNVLIVPAIAVALVAMSWTGAYAGGDHFEIGFKTEMGAIAARATVGLGVGLVHGVVHGDHHHGHHHGHHHKHGRYYAQTVVYQPYPVPPPLVERRVVYYYGPGPRVYRPCR